ncbi:MAG: septal ring lytic transglycosylase RlpA family protein [Alphaproteobacteria bacterium]|nr:MAG: septal ring lytic transglycosylase RlpA family protein [Alphaproteobacteria bacterium]
MPPEERLSAETRSIEQGTVVMVAIGKARVGIGAKMVTGAALIAAVLTVGGAEKSYAQTAAPIVYKASSTATPNIRLENRAEGMTLNVAPHAPIPTFANSPNASFGPAPLSSISRAEAPSGLATASPAAFAKPYAGPPYQVAGKWYVPAYEPNYDEVGIASWYGPTFHGKESATGETFDEMAMTAAHPTLPIPSLVRVTNLENGKTVIVRLNDRGPFVDDRIIDLSKAAGGALDLHGKGTAKVRVQYVGPAPAEANAAPVQPATQQLVVRSQNLAPVTAQPTPVSLVVPAPSPAEAKNGFFLQAGSFADLGNANILRGQLRANGPVSITSVQVNGSEFFRVMVGPWVTRAEADQAQARLMAAGTKALIVAK